MEFETAKEELKSKYVGYGFEITGESDTELQFNYRNRKYVLCEESIQLYGKDSERFPEYECEPNACSIVSLNYREQVIQPLDQFRARGMILFRDDRKLIFGQEDGDEIRVEIGYPSNLFNNFFRFHDGFLDASLSRPNPYRSEAMDLSHVSIRYPTVKVFNINESSITSAVKSTDSLIDSCLFELSYLKEMPFGILEEWPQRFGSRPIEQFRLEDRHIGFDLQLPKKRFNSDLIRFYQLAVSSNIPILQFLAFYQVLEYFFVTVSDERLYERIERQIIDPRFRSTEAQLNRIIQSVLDHKRTTDETEMLKRVLEKYIDENELIEFIKKYEETLDERHYTKRRKRFGQDSEIKLVPGHIFGNVAKTIKIVRNALVHSSDWHERSERHVPFSKGTEIVRKEVPLVRFLAERIIIGSTI